MAALSIDVVCSAAEDILDARLATALTGQSVSPPLEAVKGWRQVPSRQTIEATDLPTGAITSPGIVGEPTRDETGAYAATWVLAIAVYARGDDYDDTTRRLRGYAAAVRDVMTNNPTLGGVVASLRWTHEEYALLDPRAARTVGGCLVEFEVVVQQAVTVSSPVAATSAGATLGFLPVPVHPAL